MRILFVTESEVSPMQGGTERVTCTYSQALRGRGHFCALAYCRPCALPLKAEWDDSICLGPGLPARCGVDGDTAIEDYIFSRGFDVIVSNLVDIRYKRRLLPLLYRSGKAIGARVLVFYHAMPGEELLGNSPRSALWRMCHGGRLASNLKDLVLGTVPRRLTEALFRGYIRSRYRLLYDNADRVVLLSERFFPVFSRLCGQDCADKLTAIANALSFSEFLPEEELGSKAHEVMILCRLDEKSKRLSLALRIWQKVEQDGAHPDWRLTIVGGGPDAAWYRAMSERLGLRNVSFEGRQEDILQYYRRAALFMMTSAYEGWGLTLTESQQMGVVPLAFGSYASLPDIIEDGVNGRIIPDGDTDAYATVLEELMTDTRRREAMAREGLRSCRRFETAKIVDRLEALFSESSGE